MEYELRRKIVKGILIGALVMGWGIFAIVIGQEVAIFGAFLALTAIQKKRREHADDDGE